MYKDYVMLCYVFIIIKNFYFSVKFNTSALYRSRRSLVGSTFGL